MRIRYGTLIEYNYRMQQYADLVEKHDQGAIAHFLSKNAKFIELQQEIKTSGALDPADPQTCDIIGEDLYYPATRNGILFYSNDTKYIHNTIQTDNVYKILPKNFYVAAQSGAYILTKMIVNYEYFLDNTNPPPSTKYALIYAIGELTDYMTQLQPNFHQQLSQDRHFIQRWFEKIR